MAKRAPWWKRWFGTRSERAAARFLKRLEYRILARNWRCELGELDLVALDGRCVVFVEVRSSEDENPLRPALSVDAEKQGRLARLGLQFMQRHGLMNESGRFDVIAVSWPAGRKEPTIEHFVSAFEPTDRFQMHS